MENPKQPLDPALVQEFVLVSHGNFDKVQSLLSQEPQLLNSAYDWGGGDWETGLGAAAHMGRRDIALFLLGQGARIDLFAAAMLGYEDVVGSVLRAVPEMRDARGPHGISLIDHARAGGADDVVRLLGEATPGARVTT